MFKSSHVQLYRFHCILIWKWYSSWSALRYTLLSHVKLISWAIFFLFSFSLHINLGMIQFLICLEVYTSLPRGKHTVCHSLSFLSHCQLIKKYYSSWSVLRYIHFLDMCKSSRVEFPYFSFSLHINLEMIQYLICYEVYIP